MNCHLSKTMSFTSRIAALAVLIVFNVGAPQVIAQNEAITIDGFTEPFRKIELSSDETGAIASLFVCEGDQVQAGDIVAKLDCRVQEIQLEIANKLATSESQRIAAAQSLEKRAAILKRLQKLRSNGHASESELIRADLELSIAESKYNTAVEEAAVRSIEARRASVQLQRRTVAAPFAGVIAKIHSREGEFLSPLHPEVCTIVQIDKLLATFNIPSEDAARFANGDRYELRLTNGQTVSATVYQIGVETDPQSGTVEIKLVIENPGYRIRSGENITINI